MVRALLVTTISDMTLRKQTMWLNLLSQKGINLIIVSRIVPGYFCFSAWVSESIEHKNYDSVTTATLVCETDACFLLIMIALVVIFKGRAMLSQGSPWYITCEAFFGPLQTMIRTAV